MKNKLSLFFAKLTENSRKTVSLTEHEPQLSGENSANTIYFN